eukprot:GHVN01053924.1.p1 GENE.GHVN01053924.1~~GHVN01053924.1.p1  ORF type:complete len:335 (+),score=20.77 GHVN01053924.1:36-1040(+)
MKSHIAALGIYTIWCVVAVICWRLSTAIKRTHIPVNLVKQTKTRFDQLVDEDVSPISLTITPIICGNAKEFPLASVVEQLLSNFSITRFNITATSKQKCGADISAADLRGELVVSNSLPEEGYRIHYTAFVVVDTGSKAEVLIGEDTSALVRVPSDKYASTALNALFSVWFTKFETGEISPASVMSFWFVSDGDVRISWNFDEQIMYPFMYDFFARYTKLFDIQVESQVVHHGDLNTIGGVTNTTSPVRVLKNTDLSRFLSIASGWSAGDVLITGSHYPLPVRNLAVYAPVRLLLLDAFYPDKIASGDDSLSHCRWRNFFEGILRSFLGCVHNH